MWESFENTSFQLCLYCRLLHCKCVRYWHTSGWCGRNWTSWYKSIHNTTSGTNKKLRYHCKKSTSFIMWFVYFTHTAIFSSRKRVKSHFALLIGRDTLPSMWKKVSFSWLQGEEFLNNISPRSILSIDISIYETEVWSKQ